MSPSSTLAPGPAEPPKAAGEETCDKVSLKCHDPIGKITACLPPSANGSRGSVLHVHNGGESYVKLKVTVLPVNYTYDNIEIPKHNFKKIDVSSNIEGSTSIRLDSGGGECVIYIRGTYQLEKMFGGHVTPINAAYLAFGMIVLVGGMWACCRTRGKERHLDRVPYQELEMEQQHRQDSLRSVNVEIADNWEQSWDDNWDEEKALSSPDQSLIRSRLANGVGANQ